MKELDSSPIEELEAFPDGSRCFVARIFDPEAGRVLRSSIGLVPEQIKSLSMLRDPGWTEDENLMKCAVMILIREIWDGSPPNGWELLDVFEMPREDMIADLKQRIAERSKTLAD